MNKLITTDNGGMPFDLDDLRWFLGQSNSDAGIYQALNNMLGYFGAGTQPNFVINGVSGSASGNDVVVTSGWVYLGEELLYCEGGTAVNGNLASDSRVYLTKSTTYDSTGSESFRSGVTYDTYQKNRATINVEQSSSYVRPDSATELTIWFNDDTEILNYLNRIMVERLPTASSTGNGVVQTATNLETQTGTSTTKVVTCAGLESRKSTQAETASGSSQVKFVTPYSLLSRTATATRTGLIEIASDSELIDHTITDKAIVPSNFNQSWSEFTVEAVDGDVIVNTSRVRFLKLGKLVHITIFVQVTVGGGYSDDYIRLKESGVTYEALQPREVAYLAGRVKDVGLSSYKNGYAVLLDSSFTSPDYFVFDINYGDGNNLVAGKQYELYASSTYEAK